MEILRSKNLSLFLIVLLSYVFFSMTIAGQKTADNKTVLANFEKNIEQGKLGEIERDLLNYAIKNPSDAKAFELLGKLRLKQNRLSEAKSLLQKSLSLDAESFSARLTLATVYFQAGEIAEARAALYRINESQITNPAARLELARSFALVGDCAKALDAAEKLPANLKNGDALPLRAACYLETGDAKNFDALIAPAKTSAKQNPSAALKFAEVLNRAARHKEAIEILRPVAAAFPKNADALILLAESEILTKDYANAKNHLAQAEKIQPDSAELLFAKSLYESERGNAAQSLELIEKTLSEKPDDEKFLKQTVISAMRAGENGKAFRAAEKLFNLKPQNAEYLYLYGAASLQNGSVRNAESALSEYFEKQPNDPRGCVAFGLTLAAQADKLDAARRQMEKCIELNPKNFEAKYQLGLSYKANGENEKAVGFLEATVRDAPNYAPALRDLGAVYLQTRQETKARPVLEKSIALNPKDADAHFQISRVYNLLGETELAKKHLEIFQSLRNPKKEGM